MNRIRIKDVDIELSLHPDMGRLIEESNSTEVKASLLQRLSKTNFYKNISIKEIQSLNTKRVVYQIPVPSKSFPVTPKTETEFIGFLNRSIVLTKAIWRYTKPIIVLVCCKANVSWWMPMDV